MKKSFICILVLLIIGLGVFVYIKKDKPVENDNVIIINGVNDFEIFAGEDIDLYENVYATDKDGNKVSLKIEGNYDLNIPGEYHLKYIAYDNDKKISKDFIIVVKEKENTIEIIDGATYINGILIINKSYSVGEDYVPKNLVSYAGIQMEQSALDALKDLINYAKDAGYTITPRTAYRSYSFQKNIYNGYLKNDTKENVDTYSARPGNSEHHCGLAVDVNSLDQAWGDTLEGLWLKENAYKYGFIIRYPKGKEEITGYMYEPWHIRYVGENLAKELYVEGEYITLEEYLKIDSKYKD